MKVKLLSRVRLLATPWTAAHQARPWDLINFAAVASVEVKRSGLFMTSDIR